MSDVSLDIFGNSEKAQQALVALEKRLDATEAKIRHVGRRGKQAGGGLASTFLNVTGAIGGTVAAATGLAAALRKIVETQRELQKGGETIEERYDKAALRFRLQAGTDEGTAKRFRNRAANFAAATGLSGEGFLAAATEAVSSGASIDQASGLAEETLTLAAALKKFDASADELGGLSGAMAAFLNASGKELTQENFRSLGEDLVGAIAGTKLELGDLADVSSKLAPVASAAGLSQRETLAIQAVLKQSGFDSSVAATAGKGILSRITAPNSRGLGALEELGLSPEDVDLVGENVSTALDRINDAFANVDERRQATVRKNLFGEEFSPAGLALAEAANSGYFDQVVSDQAAGVGKRADQIGAVLQSDTFRLRRLEAQRDRAGIQLAESSTDGFTVREKELIREREQFEVQAGGNRSGVVGKFVAGAAETFTGGVEYVTGWERGIDREAAGENVEINKEMLRSLQGIDRNIRTRADRNAHR